MGFDLGHIGLVRIHQEHIHQTQDAGVVLLEGEYSVAGGLAEAFQLLNGKGRLLPRVAGRDGVLGDAIGRHDFLRSHFPGGFGEFQESALALYGGSAGCQKQGQAYQCAEERPIAFFHENPSFGHVSEFTAFPIIRGNLLMYKHIIY